MHTAAVGMKKKRAVGKILWYVLLTPANCSTWAGSAPRHWRYKEMSCCILYIIRCDHTGCGDTVGRRKAHCEPHGNTGRLNKISKKIRHNAPAIRIFLPGAEKKG